MVSTLSLAEIRAGLTAAEARNVGQAFDAIIAATGQRRGASRLVTQDRDMGHRPSILPTRAPARLG